MSSPTLAPLLDRAIRSHNQATGKGVDMLAPADLAQLPPEARQALAGLYHRVEDTWQWPMQLLEHIIWLAMKPNGKDRALGLIPLPARLWGRVRGSMADSWGERWCQHWDNAVKGSSSIQVALRRCLKDEAVAAMGMDTATALCDIEGFYDHVQLPRLFDEAIKWHYPVQLFAINIGLSLGTRILQWAGWAAEGIDPRRSLLTGERFSNHLSRVAVYSIVEHVTWSVPRLIGGLWVDDLSLRLYGTTRSIQPGITDAMIAVSRGLKQAGFTLASKTKLTTSELKLACTILQNLARAGVHISTGAEAPDLGLDTGAGSRRARHKHATRFGLSFKKVKRILAIKRGRSDRAAASIWRTSAWAQGAYAAQAVGLTKTEVRRLRTAFARTVDGGDKTRCITTIIAIRDDLANDPAIRQPVDQLRQWLKAWCEDDELRAMTTRAWPRILRRIAAVPEHQRWRQCLGPIAALQITLLDLGWTIPEAGAWTDHRGQQWRAPLYTAKLVKHDHALFLKTVADAAECGLWREAARFRRGKGLEHGCHYRHVTALYRKLNKNGNYLKAGAVATVASGASWPMSDRHEAGWSESAICCRCGQEPETWLHQTWTCPNNKDMDSFKKIAHLEQQAIDQAECQPCLWARGLVPKAMIRLPDPPASADLQGWQLEGDLIFTPAGAWPGWAVVATDASGGPWASDPMHRRIGASMVQADLGTLRPIAAIDFNLAEDEPQEVGLGELMCLLLLLRHSRGNVLMVTDRESVWEGWTERVWTRLDARQT